ncbi:mannitol dehydrogenase family protein [Jannaschia aquimarina]|uniref:Por protein n=1 Tax=Jannaschia aquimarina TaxID=935700 RepID=A0A0D1CJT6_9RHOB|nr:mannitol dehydrogenase family protein [Jannaschia aquimarina]KIT14997.1 Polyol:NADP oxidoreductase [Jannaschia aquimarina]SNS61552.1 fructuronate reductase [Jannaschia aquimarina]
MPTQLHIGLGAFHRAHQAPATQEAGGWDIIGVSLRSPDVRDRLRPQDWDYTLAVKDRGGTEYRRITVVRDVLVAPEDPDAVLAAIADPGIPLVTITVTEKGYCLRDGTLDLHHPDIGHDLTSAHPRSLVGFLARGLARRNGPMTVLSCDNLPSNGRVLEWAVRDFAQVAGLALPAGTRFPCSMVDRITPRTTEDLRSEIRRELGLDDAAPVETEAFTEWVIEDAFAGPRPRWERAGVAFVDDVAPYEKRKLRMLNGAHSLLAYAGHLAGHRNVHEAVADPDLRKAAVGLMDAAARTVGAFAEGDLAAYRDALLERFANPNLDHALLQIAMDGSEKVPVRWLDTAADLIAKGEDSAMIAAAFSAWARFLRSRNEAGERLDDPRTDDLVRLVRETEGEAYIRALLSLVDGRSWPDEFVRAAS